MDWADLLEPTNLFEKFPLLIGAPMGMVCGVTVTVTWMSVWPRSVQICAPFKIAEDYLLFEYSNIYLHIHI